MIRCKGMLFFDFFHIKNSGKIFSAMNRYLCKIFRCLDAVRKLRNISTRLRIAVYIHFCSCAVVCICTIRRACPVPTSTGIAAQTHRQYHDHCCRANHDPERRLAIIQYMADPVLHMIFTKRKQGTDGTAPIAFPFPTGNLFQQCIGIYLLALLAEKLHNFFIAGHLTVHIHQIKCQPHQRVKPVHTADQQSCRFEEIIPALQMHSLVAQHNVSALGI